MLEKMPTPCRTTTNEESETPHGSNDSRHMIPSFKKKCEDMAIHCENNANVLFSIWNLCSFHPHLNLCFFFFVLAEPCLDLLPLPTFFHHGQNKLHMSLDLGSPIFDRPCHKFKAGVKVYMSVEALCKPSRKAAKNYVAILVSVNFIFGKCKS